MHYLGDLTPSSPKLTLLNEGGKENQMKKATTEEFIAKAKTVHGDKYDYSKVEYKNNRTKVCITCPEHGDFWQVSADHLAFKGCPKCGRKRTLIAKLDSTSKFIIKAKAVHGNAYDYSDVDYRLSQSKVRIKCKKHGEFEQRPNDHLSGAGCFKCGKDRLSEKFRLTTEEFIVKANSAHGNKYDYSESTYTNAHAKIKITCKDHGSFLQTPGNHLSGQGCPACSRTGPSKPELEISDYIWSLGVANDNSRRDVLPSGKELDIFVPSHNLAIEFNGIHWHSERHAKDIYNILHKSEEAWAEGIDLIHVREDLWNDKKDIYKSVIRNRLGLNSNKTWARKCKLRSLGRSEFKAFCEENHLQGYRGGKTMRGLFFKGELVAAMNSNKVGELVRYVVKKDWSVGAGLKRLIKGVDIRFSFCDLSHFNGRGYVIAGFEEEARCRPNYRYEKGEVTVSRQTHMRHKLEKAFGQTFAKSQTEVQICNANGWYRIFDCGNIKFTMKDK